MQAATDENGTAVVTTDGDIDGGNAHLLLATLLPLAREHDHVVVDMRKTRTMTSKGLAALLDSCRLLDERGRLTIINASDDVATLLELTGLSRLAEVRPGGRQRHSRPRTGSEAGRER